MAFGSARGRRDVTRTPANDARDLAATAGPFARPFAGRGDSMTTTIDVNLNGSEVCTTPVRSGRGADVPRVSEAPSRPFEIVDDHLEVCVSRPSLSPDFSPGEWNRAAFCVIG
jgi:hypothetical protein